MLYALMVCSDNDCTDELEASGSLEELESAACDCGCTMQVVSVSEVEFEETTRGYALAQAA